MHLSHAVSIICDVQAEDAEIYYDDRLSAKIFAKRGRYFRKNEHKMPIILWSFVTAVKIDKSVYDRIEMLINFLVTYTEKLNIVLLFEKSIELQSCRLVQLPMHLACFWSIKINWSRYYYLMTCSTRKEDGSTSKVHRYETRLSCLKRVLWTS